MRITKQTAATPRRAYCAKPLREGAAPTADECHCSAYRGEHEDIVRVLEGFLCEVTHPGLRVGLLGVVFSIAGPQYAAYVDAWTSRKAHLNSAELVGFGDVSGQR